MGREDSHYRPDGVDGRGSGGSGSGAASGRVRVPGVHPSDRSAGPSGPGSDRPPQGPDRPAAGSARVPSGPPPAAGSARPAGSQVYGSTPVSPASGPVPVSPAVGAVPVSPPPAGANPPSPPAPAPRRRRRLLPVAAFVAVLLLALAGFAVLVRPGPVAGWLGDEADPPATARAPEPDPAPVLAGPDAGAPQPTPDGVRAALDPLLGQPALGSRVNVSVADVTTGQSLFTRGGDDGTVPASVTKLATGVTVLEARGPGHRIPTRAVAGANPGEVVLVGGGDPTLAVDGKGFYPGAARLDTLAAQVKQALGGTAPTRVIVDSTLFPGPVHAPGWDPDIPTGGYGAAITALMTDGARTDPETARRTFDDTHGAAQRDPQPDLAAGRAFARLLGLGDAPVTKGRAPADAGASTGAAPAPGAELGKVESLPMIRLVDIMISDSDNVVAEALARQVALARNQPASFSGGAAAMDAVLAELGLPADEITLSDASGLSRKNRISPSLLTDLIALAGKGDHPELAGIFGGLPVGAWSGTLGDRYRAAATKAGAGAVRAKTGTLTGVHAIAGLVTTAEGRLLTFAVLTDRAPAGDPDVTRQALDRITGALAACGCR
ncbi:D-alanyl-D-alanine carboxypeptidase/D-alanyl-D-alanine endopeptidase [Micromonospora coxensis]|uniref:D-alanyl-D-alanine carboxypeptidase / D-alanyl-D-alanine-endopeptidase (Penicillin-binding protein 4) n=1 Tax=Micromonospora coxensis TaxID=356852 RepID=A0A1C5IK14_9ACTN|nr:D-alanyl-D-alanine carboxypeptidase / D-alanyl-D-alanine-endopeptidase (penicillin-binding protein 4) [Micromonospora coxensis]